MCRARWCLAGWSLETVVTHTASQSNFAFFTELEIFEEIHVLFELTVSRLLDLPFLLLYLFLFKIQANKLPVLKSYTFFNFQLNIFYGLIFITFSLTRSIYTLFNY